MNKLADPSHPLGLPDLVDGVGGQDTSRQQGCWSSSPHLLGRLDPLHTLGGHLDHLRALDSRLNHLHAHDGYLYYLLALCGHLEHLLTLRDQLLCVGVIGNQLDGVGSGRRRPHKI